MKKFISILCIFLLFTECVSASVVPDSKNEDTVTVSGTLSVGEGEKVTVTVFPHGKSFDSENINYGYSSDILSYVGTENADSNGTITLKWEPDKSGYYDIYFSADGEIKNRELNVYIPAKLKTLYDIIRNGTVDELQTELSKDGRLLDVLRNEDDVKNVTVQNLSNAIYYVRDAADADTDMEKIVTASKNLSLLASKKTAESLYLALQSLKDASITLSFAENYEKLATNDIKTEMAQKMSDICKKTIPQIDSYLNDSLILAGVYKSQNWMDGVNFFKILGYPTGERKINAAASEITGKKYDTISKLKEAIDSVIGSGGGGGGTTSFSGNTTPSRVDNVNPDILVDASDVDTQTKQDDIFADVKNTHYAFDDINYLRWHQVVSGDEKGNFNPDNYITRAEVLKILCEVFDINGSFVSAFNDVESDSWYADFVGGAYSAGLIYGSDDGCFNPNETVTRQDLAVMLYRFCEYSQKELKDGDITFSDKDEISDYALKSVSVLCANEIINGMDNNNFSPFEGATRAQTACMIARYMRNFGEGGI